MDTGLVHLGISERLLYRLQNAAEEVSIKVLKPGTTDTSIEVDAFKQRINLD